ncbi:hypothetical protein KTO58_26475 [Chitinophaga pendula]|uniref:terpene synthase family protein n=1 Tax=Chitinophaga TaxID=79328 RepID=UPI000BB0937A|nr:MULTISPECIES: hypothetical protein [Chitinophaga]ASZ09891.1 hypothetical protein CK934_02295 [Chitinophaga sp. MD30]UCJ07168.1 hypothetical protein KTO58_26475 [Chitinophaga pendula]
MRKTEYCLEFPAPSAISPYAEAAQEHTINWAIDFGLVPDPKHVNGLRKAKFGIYAAREFPGASCAEICLTADLITWLFFVDDRCDRASSDRAAAATVRVQLRDFLDILDGRPVDADTPMNRGLQHVMQRFAAISSLYLYEQLCHYIRVYLNECFWEIDNQVKDYVPTIAEYWAMRAKTGFSIMFPLVGIFSKLELPDEVYKHEVLQRMELALNLAGGLANDIHSLHREQQLDTAGFNLIFIFQQELQVSQEEAVQLLMDHHNDQLSLLEQCRRQLPYWGKRINEQLNTYVDGLFVVLKAYYDWALDSNRYA